MQLSGSLTKRGWTVWLDTQEMCGNMNACMASGIENCKVVIVLVTRDYADKVSSSAANDTSDNCMNELKYAFEIKKKILSVIVDPDMANPQSWPSGMFSFLMAGLLYVDASDKSVDATSDEIETQLKRRSVFPLYVTRRKTVLYV